VRTPTHGYARTLEAFDVDTCSHVDDSLVR
jgi:hypothetical protein